MGTTYSVPMSVILFTCYLPFFLAFFVCFRPFFPFSGGGSVPSAFCRFSSASSVFISIISTLSFSSHSSTGMGVDVACVLFAVNPGGRIAILPQVRPFLRDASGARSALLALDRLEIGHAGFSALAGDGFLPRIRTTLRRRCLRLPLAPASLLSSHTTWPPYAGSPRPPPRWYCNWSLWDGISCMPRSAAAS